MLKRLVGLNMILFIVDISVWGRILPNARWSMCRYRLNVHFARALGRARFFDFQGRNLRVLALESVECSCSRCFCWLSTVACGPQLFDATSCRLLSCRQTDLVRTRFGEDEALRVQRTRFSNRTRNSDWSTGDIARLVQFFATIA